MKIIFSKPKKFKDYISKTFLFYSIIIIMILFGLFILTMLFSYKSTVVKTNETYNNYLSNYINSEYKVYKKNIDYLVQSEVIKDSLKKDRNLTEANRLLYNFCNRDNISANFALINSTGHIVTTSLYRDNKRALYQNNTFTKLFDYLKTNPMEIYSDINPVNFYFQQQSKYFIAKSILSNEGVEGYLILFLKDEDIRDYIRYKDVDIAIIADKYDNVIFSPNNLILDNMGKAKFNINKKNTTEFNGQHYYIVLNEAKDNELKVITLTSINEHKEFLVIGAIFLLFISIVMVILVLVLSPILTEYNLRSFDTLLEALEELTKGNMDYRIQSKTFDEFQIIYDGFNSMMSKIQLLLKDNNEILERKRLMEIKNLESQFNPHFIFNVLEMLRYEILFQPELASDMVVSFANLLRYNINYGNMAVSLKTDIEYMEDYLKLQKKRFNKRLSYNMDIDQSLLNCRVPKLLFQPIVENSIKYGIENTEQLIINISIKKKANDIIISIDDNGPGLEEEELANLLNILENENTITNHIGIYNVYRLIKLLYGDEYGLSITSDYGIGTTVILIIPIIGDELNV